MNDIAIKVEGLGKKYKIGSRKIGDLRESFGLFWRKIKGSVGSWQLAVGKKQFVDSSSTSQLLDSPTPRLPDSSDFWALKDISFDIKQGEAVGIIGRNGAGKSTLLKILSRITKPTTGRFEINGRVSSLLEVGTGFHKELTGRENIFLNGTILGMKRREVKQKFDEIVDFSGVEQFIDTPVKHYSSGMLVRLAFSVAAHLEPEILIIDEVLAVGDAEFQKKCLGKMEDVTGQGRTVLFVSHNMGAVRSLCGRGILLDEGYISIDDQVPNVIQSYLAVNATSETEVHQLKKNRTGTGKIIFHSIHFIDEIGNKVDRIESGSDINLLIELISQEDCCKVDIGISIHDTFDSIYSVLYSSYQNINFKFQKGTNIVRLKIKNISLGSGIWHVRGLIKDNNEVTDWPKFILAKFIIEVGNFYQTGHIGDTMNDVKLLLKGEWL
jgi:lipopolysaccharide transport system ATP-binding protein